MTTSKCLKWGKHDCIFYLYIWYVILQPWLFTGVFFSGLAIKITLILV